MAPEILYHRLVRLSRGKTQKMCKKMHNPKMCGLCKITIKKIKKSVDKCVVSCYNKDTKGEEITQKKRR
jgi:hypothetical protein